MTGEASDIVLDGEGLRERNVPVRAQNESEARKAVLELNAQEELTQEDEEKRKTYGRTPDGVVFTVPYTHDMVSQLLSPSEPKNISDLLVLLVMLLHVLLLWLLPASARIPIFGVIFLSWRAGYNVGIGYLLHVQSHQKKLTRWARLSRIFVNPSTGKNPHPQLYNFIKRELETKIPKDYKFEDAPLEYNTWLVFRRIVDLILMCDFTSYCLFAIACCRQPTGENMLGFTLRWAAGVILFLFNLWVKLDAHRVVKDFAWYWGDFFYLIDQELTFDGVFEMAPHPMYSVGYAGYYGISLMAASYKVLFISIIAHAAQFAFLVWVESPHIERTYSSPSPRSRVSDLQKSKKHDSDSQTTDSDNFWDSADGRQMTSSVHNLLGVQNIDLYRTIDSSILILQFFIVLLTVLTPNTPLNQALFVANAALWRLWYSVGIGYLLNRQSEKKKWTRHFVKYGESSKEAWRQWKGTYHLSMTLCYTSFVAAAWKMYSIPSDWSYGLTLLKHVVGLGLVALQIWVSVSIYDSLGEFGWFFGDFFFDKSPKLSYGGIYRFLNNPERVLGLAGVWGVALITSSRGIFCLALLSHTLSLAFIQFVERPHMQKLYGRHLRQEAGLVRSLRRSLPPPLRQWQEGMDKVLGETFDFVEDFLDAARPKLAAGVNTIVKDTKHLFNNYPARISITRVEPEVVGFNPKDYSLTLEGTASSPLAESQRSSDKEGLGARTSPSRTSSFKTQMFEYGAPIRVKWTAPVNHSKKDWVGLYMVADNASREVTKVASLGRWIATDRGEYDSLTAEIGLVTPELKQNGTCITNKNANSEECVSGEMIFSGDKLWWTQGVFEFRYHHKRLHNVMAISLPFEVRIPRFDEDDMQDVSPSFSFSHPTSLQNETVIRSAIEIALLPVVQNCFDRDPEIAPRTVSESFGSLVERDGKFAKRVVYAVQATFGVEFAPEVVQADGKVTNLAWRIWEAKKVLVRPRHLYERPL